MSLIVSIETATPVCSVALHDSGNLLAFTEIFVEQSHSVFLTVMIEELLAKTSHQLHDLSAVALSKGPGSYTGLRIGTSTAKGLCYALDIPLISINTLEAMAEGLHKTIPTPYWFCPMIDARRMEVYCAVYDQHLEEKLPTEAKIITENAFEEILETEKVIFFGNGAEKAWQYLCSNENAYWIPDIVPSAKNMEKLAYLRWQKQDFEDLAYFEPFYLKDFIGTTPKKMI